MKFYRCLECEKMYYNEYEKNTLKCCNKSLTEIIPLENLEDHEIKIKQVGSFVNISVNENNHPFNMVHHLDFILLETNFGSYYRSFNDFVVDKYSFFLIDNEIIKNIFIYCNLFGLIKN